MSKNEVSTVTQRVQELLRALPVVDKKWNKPWWNTAVETPIIECFPQVQKSLLWLYRPAWQPCP